ncbi:AFG1/ZapE family ATPase [Alicyclobacillus tolerans]|uniref:Replicative DNA helicase loader DnaI n=1 Tax=Alicyclobacillus tolerans TaxID=90970 RepID=A0A1M6S2M8_9BACL|nr:AFG1/ZapE family ATPase [Alicyclobacillus montanus]SHK38737.1 replicative DNA helicase loader DnaI [Alicyclobacillus montanus]
MSGFKSFGDSVPEKWKKASKQKGKTLNVNLIRKHIPELDNWALTDQEIIHESIILLEHIKQQKICQNCTGYTQCQKEGDMKGFIHKLRRYGGQIVSVAERCEPYQEHEKARIVQEWSSIIGIHIQDKEYTLDNFPLDQKNRYLKLFQYCIRFANEYHVKNSYLQGVYVFGSPGVGKTHLVLGVFNRLQERGIPCLFLRSDSIFDRMRHLISEDKDLEPFIEACCNVPVLAIDEFAQERANDFTMEKLFRIINYRFHAKLPTWFTSNFSPPDIYKRGGADIQESVAALRSRILQMSRLAKIEGEDYRQKNLKSLT